MPPMWKKVALGRTARFRPDCFTLFLASLAVLGGVLVLLHEVTYGATLEWDSVTYIAVARNLLAGNGFFQSYDGAYYVYWPPLFPGLLALASLSIFDPHEVAGLVNAIAFGLTIFFAGRWLRKRIESWGLVLWGCLAITLSAPLIQNTVWVISEPVFILFTLLALVETEKFLNTERLSYLIRSALFTALACLTRYSGISIVITTVLLLLFKSAKPFWKRSGIIAVHSVIAITPLGIWLLRNLLVSGTLTGWARSHPPFASFLEYLSQTLEVMAGWAVPFLNPVPTSATVAVGIALLALAIGTGMAFTHREAEIRPDENALALFGSFALIHHAFLLVAASTSPVQVGARHMCPVYIPLLFIVAFSLGKLLQYERERTLPKTVVDRPRAGVFYKGSHRVSPVAAIMASVLALWLAGSAVVTGRSIQAANGDGSEYFSWNLSSARFADSAVLRYMREHPVTGWVYSNEHFGVYIHTDGSAKYTVLHETEQQLIHALQECASSTAGFQCDPPLHSEHRLVQALGEQAAVDYDVHIVWLHDIRRHVYDYDSLGLRALPGAEIVADLADGVILRITPGHFDMDRYAANKAAPMTASIKAADEPIIRSGYDVYRNDKELIYVKDACNQDDANALFSLHWAPADKTHLADYWKEYGFNVLDFRLEEYGVRSGDKCVAVVALPEYDISRIKTGQFVYGQDKELVWLWRENVHLAE